MIKKKKAPYSNTTKDSEPEMHRESIPPQQPGGKQETGATPSPPIPAGTFSPYTVAMSYISLIVKLEEMDSLTFREIERQVSEDTRLSDMHRETIIPLLHARWRYLATGARR